MSFEDLAKIEGYDFDAIETELKAAKMRIAELEAENKRLEDNLETARQELYALKEVLPGAEEHESGVIRLK